MELIDTEPIVKKKKKCPYNPQYYQTHKEEMKANTRKYVASRTQTPAKAEAVRLKQKEYREKYYLNNVDKFKQYSLKYKAKLAKLNDNINGSV